MQMNSLPAGGAVVVVEIEVSPVTLYTRGPQTFFCEGHIIFTCFNGGRVGLWQKITLAGVTSIIKIYYEMFISES